MIEPAIATDRHIVLNYDDLAIFRTKMCEKHRQGRCQDPDRCPDSHCHTWQRRNPLEYAYSAKLCSDIKFVKQKNKMNLIRRCSRGRACCFAHSKEEELYHPTIYKTKICSFHSYCTRYYCPFAHSENELRVLNPIHVPRDDSGLGSKRSHIPALQHAPFLQSINSPAGYETGVKQCVNNSLDTLFATLMKDWTDAEQYQNIQAFFDHDDDDDDDDDADDDDDHDDEGHIKCIPRKLTPKTELHRPAYDTAWEHTDVIHDYDPDNSTCLGQYSVMDQLMQETIHTPRPFLCEHNSFFSAATNQNHELIEDSYVNGQTGDSLQSLYRYSQKDATLVCKALLDPCGLERQNLQITSQASSTTASSLASPQLRSKYKQSEGTSDRLHDVCHDTLSLDNVHGDDHQDQLHNMEGVHYSMDAIQYTDIHRQLQQVQYMLQGYHLHSNSRVQGYSTIDALNASASQNLFTNKRCDILDSPRGGNHRLDDTCLMKQYQPLPMIQL